MSDNNPIPDHKVQPIPLYFEVAVAAPIHQTLSYAPPPGVKRLAPGYRLLVPLGRRQVTGYLLACHTEQPAFNALRAALAVLDDEPLFPAAMVPFFRWIADYYHHPIGEVIQHALPAGLSRRSTRIIKLTDRGARELPSLLQASGTRRHAPSPPPNASNPRRHKASNVTDHGIDGVSGHGVPQVAASETAMRTSVREPARSLQDAVPRDRLPSDWLPELLTRGELSAAKSATVIRRRPPELKRWQEEGLIEIDNRLRRESVRAKTETIIIPQAMPPATPPPSPAATESSSPAASSVNVQRVVGPGKRLHPTPPATGAAIPPGAAQEPAPLKPSEQKTLELLRELAGGNSGGPGASGEPPVPGDPSASNGHNTPSGVPRRELLKRYPGAGRALKELLTRNLISTFEQRLYRDPFGDAPPFFPRPEQLTAEQSTVMARLTPAIDRREYAPFLLHGITGSGKTEIYLRAAEATLAQGRQVLVLVPEIALATQLEGHFCSRFGNAVALLHSGLSGGQRFDQWSLLLGGEAKIAIGARSAIFAPLPAPGLIIVDEEHDPAYKQEEGLRYNARDLALLRGLQQQATVILGSATPAVSSYHAARQGKFELLEMTRRVEDRPLPTVEIVDLKEVKTVSGLPPLFSPQLVRALKENLVAGHQSLVFLNRRGFANLVLCKDCGRPVQCRHCQVSLTYHKKADALLCHHCGYRQPRASLCPHCRSGTLVPAGFGTERLEEELRRHFPAARLARLDQDTSRDRKEFFKVLKAVRDQEVDILIGTQMITKGHHFPQVTLVGIVWADAGLGIPDYKAAERTFQLLTQVTGRAGRGEQPGRVLVQTLQSEHYSIALAQAHDYQGLFEQEIALRRRLGFPPWGRLINLRFDGEKEEKVQELAQKLGEFARQAADPATRVLGPAPAPLSRLKDRFRWQLLLKGQGVAPLHRLCQALLGEYTRLAGSSTVKLSLDVDPENML